MQNIQPIPFNHLIVWDGNVRHTGSSNRMDELVASISEHGLLQPIVVKDSGNGTFAVIAGRRRFLALQQLVEDKKYAQDAPVACTVINDAFDNTEIGLAENAMQLPMHPADKFEAFRDLADKGMAASDIAVRFGLAESSVIKLMKLGRVSPEVMAAYREDKIDYARVQAFTISDDVSAQNKVLEMVLNTHHRLSPDSIRSQLVKDEIPATDKRVHFVGLEFYEMCGGTVRRDLFDDKNSGYIQDTDLLDQLVETKLQSTIDELKAEGWKWVEVLLEYDWQYCNQFGRIEPRERELPAGEAQKLKALLAEYEALLAGHETCEEQEHDLEALLAEHETCEEQESDLKALFVEHETCEEQESDDEGNDNPEVAARLQELQQMIEALQAGAVEWPAEDKAIAGVLVSLNTNGDLDIERGLVKPEDAGQPDREDGIIDNSGSGQKNAKPEFSAALLKDLTSYRTAALRIELARNPDIALVSVVHALAMRVLYNREREKCLKISGTQRTLFAKSQEPVPSVIALEEERNTFSIPEDIGELWDWCLGRSQAELLKLLAVCAAYSVDAVQERDMLTHDRIQADQLASALKLDMRKWFTATADNMFNRISRKQIIEAYTEATGEPPSNGVLDLKKKDMAIRAGREIGDKWLPSVLRQPEPAAAE